jgi:hypothetical protein
MTAGSVITSYRSRSDACSINWRFSLVQRDSENTHGFTGRSASWTLSFLVGVCGLHAPYILRGLIRILRTCTSRQQDKTDLPVQGLIRLSRTTSAAATDFNDLSLCVDANRKDLSRRRRRDVWAYRQLVPSRNESQRLVHFLWYRKTDATFDMATRNRSLASQTVY